ncbi:MAG: hypothetical protein Q7R75_00965 [bacterium]|nr:hypothetical protein [bacterium]
MENLEEKEKEKFEEFKKEILEIANKERESKKMADFERISLDTTSLTPEDMRLWNKVKDGTVTMKDVDEHAKDFKDAYSAPSPSMRVGFLSLARGRASVIIVKRQLEEMKQKNG